MNSSDRVGFEPSVSLVDEYSLVHKICARYSIVLESWKMLKHLEISCVKYLDLRLYIEVTLDVSQLETGPEHPVAPLGHVCAPASDAETRKSAATSHAQMPLLNAHVFLNLTVRGSIVFEISRICATQQISMAI